MSTENDSRKSRPPHATFKIRELIKMEKWDEAQTCTDENVEFYRSKIGDQQSLFLAAQCGKLGVRPTAENMNGASRHAQRERARPLGELLAEDEREGRLRANAG